MKRERGLRLEVERAAVPEALIVSALGMSIVLAMVAGFFGMWWLIS